MYSREEVIRQHDIPCNHLINNATSEYMRVFILCHCFIMLWNARLYNDRILYVPITYIETLLKKLHLEVKKCTRNTVDINPQRKDK